jgi:hypothetical protein
MNLGFSFAFVLVVAVFGRWHHKVTNLINVFRGAVLIGMVRV